MIWKTIYSKTAVYGEKWVCYFWSLAYFYTLSKTLIACRDMQLRFFKVKTSLNNAFKQQKCSKWQFLAHPVRRTRWAYAMVWRPSSVRPSVLPSVRPSVRPSVLPSVHSFQNASSSSFLNRFWFWLFHKIGLGGGFKTSTQNCEIHYLW